MYRAIALTVLIAGCNFRILGLPLWSGGDDLAMPTAADASMMPASGDLAGPVAPPDLATAPDLGAANCPSTNCSTTCTPCCQESCTTGMSCSQSCPGSGCDCSFTCSGPKSCNVSCAGGSTCVALADNANDGTLDCSGNATCWLQCGSNLKNSCTLNCAGNASCRIDCGTNVKSCTLANCSPVSCPNNVQVCGRACP